MKKIKVVTANLLIFAMLLCFCGCQLKKPESESETTAGDKLIGALITTESLNTFDIEKYLQEHIGEVVDSAQDGTRLNVESDRTDYQNKIYAEETDVEVATENGDTVGHKEYVFKDIDGFWIFDALISATETEESYTCLCLDGGLSNIHSKTSSTDNEVTSSELSADLYYSYELWGTVFYMNPVYQEADGDIYTVEGTGYAVSGDKGSIDGNANGSQSISDKLTFNKDGEETTYESTVTVNFIPVYVPEEISFIFMDDSNRALDEESFAPEKVPQKLKVPQNTQYVIVEEKNEKGSQVDVIGKGDEWAEYICEDKDKICSKQSVEIIWSE